MMDDVLRTRNVCLPFESIKCFVKPIQKSICDYESYVQTKNDDRLFARRSSLSSISICSQKSSRLNSGGRCGRTLTEPTS